MSGDKQLVRNKSKKEDFMMNTVKLSSLHHKDKSGAFDETPFTNTVKRVRTLSRRVGKKHKGDKVPTPPAMSSDSLKRQLCLYNSKCDQSFKLFFKENKLEGYIPVYLWLDGPVKVMTPSGVGMVWNSLNIDTEICVEDDLESSSNATIENLMLENNAKTMVYLDNHTMAFEAVTLLIRKLFIMDNPADFVLYEHDHGKFRKVGDTEIPLTNVLNQPYESKDWRLLLKRRPLDDKMSQWQCFAEPELRNFLAMADFEFDMKKSNLEKLFKCVREDINVEIKRREDYENNSDSILRKKNKVKKIEV